MIRVFYRDSEGEWWLETLGLKDAGIPYGKPCPARVSCLSELPPPICEYLTMLNLADVGQTIEGVGKRISKNTFWVFV